MNRARILRILPFAATFGLALVCGSLLAWERLRQAQSRRGGRVPAIAGRAALTAW